MDLILIVASVVAGGLAVSKATSSSIRFAGVACIVVAIAMPFVVGPLFILALGGAGFVVYWGGLIGLVACASWAFNAARTEMMEAIMNEDDGAPPSDVPPSEAPPAP